MTTTQGDHDMPTKYRILEDGRVHFTVELTHRKIDTDRVVEVIDDIALDFNIIIDATHELLGWLNDPWRMFAPCDRLPETMTTQHVAQAIADIIAVQITMSDRVDFDEMFQQMNTDSGVQYDALPMTLWMEHGTNDTLLVWLGNEYDFDMTRTSRAMFALS